MRIKLSLSWCGLAVAVLSLLGFAAPLPAQNSPWPPLVFVLSYDPDAVEAGSDPATFLVVRTGPANTPLTVHYELGGTATNGVDYAALSGSVTIPQGAWFAPVTVTPIDDFTVEGAESVVIALQQPAVSPPPYIVTWPAVAVAEIVDNDPSPTNTPPSVSLVNPPEGAVFDFGENISLLARAEDRDGRVLAVQFFDGTNLLAIVTNQLLVPVPLPVPTANFDPSFDLDIKRFPDLGVTPIKLPAPGQFFRFVWENAPPGHHTLTAIAVDDDGSSTLSSPVGVTVLEVSPQAVVHVRAIDPVASEPTPASNVLDTATFRIHRSGPTNLALTVFYRLGGTASNGVDYAPLPLRAEIPVGQRTVDVIVQPVDDSLVEGIETVALAIEEPVCIKIFPPPPDCYAVGRARTARAVIRDNDSPPNSPPLVRLVKPEDGEVFRAPADIQLAALARDFDGTVVSVEFFEGTNSLGVVANNLGSVSSARPPFSLAWSNVTPGNYVLTALATDNAGATTPSMPVEIKVVPKVGIPEVNLFTIDGEGAEMGPLAVVNPAIFSVVRTGEFNRPLVVFYEILGTASNGVDYVKISGQIELASGAISNRIIVNPIEDNLAEGTETVVLRLFQPPVASSADWYRIGDHDTARAVILDNDGPKTNRPPKVVITQPHDGESFGTPANIKISAAATDPDGWVGNMKFYADNQLIGERFIVFIQAPPPGETQEFSLIWSNAPAGEHVLTARGTDDNGASGLSDPVHIRVGLDTRPTLVTIVATDPQATEGFWRPTASANTLVPPKTATFTVFRKGRTDLDLTVYYKLGGTASNGLDYRALSGQVKIPRGQDRATIVVEPIDDTLVEDTETVVARLEAPACIAIFPPPPECYTVGDPGSATAFIADNDFNATPRVEIVQPESGDAFRTGSDIEIEVAARDPDGYVPNMKFYAHDELIGEQTIHFFVKPPPGQTQKFSLVWSNVPTGEYVLTAVATDDQGGKSRSDPVKVRVSPLPKVPVVTLRAVDAVGTEQNPILAIPMDVLQFDVTRTGETTLPLTVAYRAGGTASNGVDYLALSGEVVIPTNEATARILVSPLDDLLVEGNESVILSLIQPTCVTGTVATAGCYLVGRPNQAIGYIRDDDAPPNRPPTVAIISPSQGAVFQSPADLKLVAAANDPDGWVVAVEFFDGTNSLGVVSNNVLVIAEPLNRVPELEAGILEGPNLVRPPFILSWKNVPPGRHELTAVALDNAGATARSRAIEITVLEKSDLPVVNLMIVDAIAREGTTNTAAFRVRRTGSTNDALTVFYAIGGTASNGVDYVTLSNSVTIPAGRYSARVVVQPINDNLLERAETVGLRLTPAPVGPDRYAVGPLVNAVALILDNDWEINAPEPLADGSLHLRMSVPLGMPYRVEASSNLADWEEVTDDVATETGVSVVDGQKREHTQRFFRLIQDFGDQTGDD